MNSNPLWDDEQPTRVIILGAGPIGLEAALYARFLGYEVTVYDRGEVAQNVLDWGHVRMFTPFSMNSSSLGLAALKGQDADYQPPDPDSILTGSEWVEQYLRPLAETDLVQPSLRTCITVSHAGRSHVSKTTSLGADRHGNRFVVLCRDAKGRAFYDECHILIDATGVSRHSCLLGDGGIPAPGELDNRRRIAYYIPDILGNDRATYAARRVLVVGSGYSAATSIAALAQLANDQPTTQVIWVTRSSDPSGPLRRIPHDRLPQRDQLAMRANQLAADANGPIRHVPQAIVRSLQQDDDERLVVELDRDGVVESLEIDEVIANVGYRPDISLFRELQVHLCYASEGPMQLATLLQENASSDCLDAAGDQSVDALVTTEPDFYLLGAKSYGRNSQFLFAHGLQQIRDLFARLGERSELDLYKNFR
ncbi:MAG: hypothetical protein KDA60_13045 [Planctomycetales bacterium]|nr:hypothetical protein [Planctomycetales bacterium]